MTKKTVRELAEEFISDEDIFLVDLRVSTSNKITVLVNTLKGITIKECVAVSRHIEHNLDREREDFELQVSSPGLDMPFMVPEQYLMNLGKKVEVSDPEGKKYIGILKNVSGNGFELEVEKKEIGKRKEKTEMSFNFDDIKSVKVVIAFK